MENGRFGIFINMLKVYAEQCSGKKNIILYGWNWNNGGTYFEWILSHYYHIEIHYIIDDNEISYGKKVYRNNLLEYINKKETIIFAMVESARICINKYGYEEGKNIFFINKELGINVLGYFEWEEKEKGLDIISRDTEINIKNVCKDGSDYAASREIGFTLACEYIQKNYPDVKILDIGCGKGGTMLLFKAFGIEKVDGIEYLKDLCETANNNLKIMNYDTTCKIFQADATKFQDLDEYNMFYLYDPFKGDTFRRVIDNIENSYYSKPRKIILVYANPWEHLLVIEHGMFQLKDVIDGDWFTRMCNVYEFVDNQQKNLL